MSADLLLRVRDLRKLYPIPRSILGTLLRRPVSHVHAIDGITFDLARGEILGLVGESGSGKSTTAMTVLGLLEPTSGSIHFGERDVHQWAHSTDRRALRLQMQMIFQDPYEALNPRQTVFQIIAEPLEVHHAAANTTERETRVIAALAAAGLKPPENFLHRYPEELSGGQRQRIVIAAALILNPQFVVADEPVSMLDVSIRAEILNLLRQMRDERGISILYITHDLATAGFFTDRIAVMYLGRIVEIGPTAEVMRRPRHPYTRALLSVIPVPNPRKRRKRQILQGEIPNPIHIPSGCRFHPRCPFADARCRQNDPILESVGNYHSAACVRLNEIEEHA